ncbi:NAD-dependent epimerase/dehydratase family protein [Acidithiobacillus montserratensis]|uniref:NAD-dependent epimerase/dehydratase family protein n=1 Tax=Acidithiobacillus montserratensis TaxID=2729135 RepID=A0ACD5HIF1_9PROT|nr:NAD-dependent epimerase/dehydratase family protein [Acidithiobacillus montserratensis]MBN2680041.1 NAD-dependent epimerase/dehydratase family protein [Acidithiobacillaceae bacterium]MBU2749378.1 NAD-dependent epimerase/dehydratase family protein [Acidithiobacillus montserratensis]
MRVMVTGAAGHTAAALLPKLLQHPDIEQVIALDTRAPALRSRKMRYLPLDIRDQQLTQHLSAVDCLIHLAFMVLSTRLGPQSRWRKEMQDVNVHGSQHLFQAAARAGVGHVIYTSSVAAYGAWPDNPVPLEESWPCRPVPGFAYSEDKATLESWLDDFCAQTPEMAVTRLRLHAIIGPHGQPLVNSIATSSFALRMQHPDLPIQCLHEEDASNALLAALENPHGGIFNIAAPDPIPWSSIPRRWHLPFNPRQLHQLHRGLRPYSRRLGDPGWLQVLENPLIVDTRRAQQVLGWQARYSVSDALSALRQAKGLSPLKAWSVS